MNSSCCLNSKRTVCEVSAYEFLPPASHNSQKMDGHWCWTFSWANNFDLSLEITQLQKRYQAVLSPGRVKHNTAMASGRYLKYQEGENWQRGIETKIKITFIWKTLNQKQTFCNAWKSECSFNIMSMVAIKLKGKTWYNIWVWNCNKPLPLGLY